MASQHFGKKMNYISHYIRRGIDHLHEPFGISGKQSRILGYIDHESQKRALYQKDIEHEFHIRRSSVTSILQNLEKAGLIERKSVSMDARLKKLVLTEKGKTLTLTTYHYIDSFEENMDHLFSEEERMQLNEYLDRILEYLDKKEKGEDRK